MRFLTTCLIGTFSVACMAQPRLDPTPPLSHPEGTITNPQWRQPGTGPAGPPSDAATGFGGSSLGTGNAPDAGNPRSLGRYDNLGTGRAKQGAAEALERCRAEQKRRGRRVGEPDACTRR